MTVRVTFDFDPEQYLRDNLPMLIEKAHELGLDDHADRLAEGLPAA